MRRYLYEDSPLTGPYYRWMCDLGYPQLDIVLHDDGEWWIDEYLNAPVVPSMTSFRTVLSGFSAAKGTPLSKSFVAELITTIDLTKRAIWDREEKVTEKMEREQASKERRLIESAKLKFEAMRNNPALMERIVKHGLGSMNLESIFQHIDPHHRRRMGYVNRQLFTPR